MRLNNKKVIKLEGDASERKFYRSKNSIIIFSKKNKKKNLLIYDAINRILNSGGICAPRLLKNNYKKNLIEVNDLGDVTLLRLLKNRKNKKKIFIKVLDLLFKVQKIKKLYNRDFTGRKYQMARYSKDKLLKEAYLFNEWYLPQRLSKKKLNQLKKNCILVNTSRGEIIDEKNLVKLIKSKKIKFFAADVVSQEHKLPISRSKIFDISHFENVYITPHMAGLTYESEEIASKICINNLKRFFKIKN